MEIDYSQEWEEHLIHQLGYYKKKAPFYKEVSLLLNELFSVKYSSIAELSMKSIELVTQYLGIDFLPYRVSQLELNPERHVAPDEWGILICKLFSNVGIYRNAPGGKSFYNVEKYNKAGLGIEFIQNRLQFYDQKNDEFFPGLSILDVMMFNTPEEINKMINDYYVL